MSFFTTKINLQSSSLPNSWATSCFQYNRDIFGGSEVTIIDAKNITQQPLAAKNDPFYLTILKIITFFVFVPLGSFCRLISFFNPDVRHAFSYTPKSNFSDLPVSKPNPPSPVIPITPSAPPPKPITQSPSASEKLSLKMTEICNDSQTTTHQIQELLNQGCCPTSKDLLAVIGNKKYNLLSCFTNQQILVIDSKDVIALLKGTLDGNCPQLATQLTKEARYSSHVDEADVNEELFKSAKAVRHVGVCEWIFTIQPSFALPVRRGLAYLNLLTNYLSDPKITKLLQQLHSSTENENLSADFQNLVNQFYIHIPFELLLLARLPGKDFENELLFYHSILTSLLLAPTSTPAKKRASHENSPLSWASKENQFLELFEKVNNKKKSEIHDLYRANELMLKQAILYVEYLKLTTSSKSTTAQKLLESYQSVLKGLDNAKIKIPTLYGIDLFKSQLLNALQSYILVNK